MATRRPCWVARARPGHDSRWVRLSQRTGEVSLSPHGGTSVDGSGTAGLPDAINFESFDAQVNASFRPTERFEILPKLNFTLQRPWNVPSPSSGSFYDKAVQRARARVSGRWAAHEYLQLAGGLDAMLDTGRLLAPGGVGLQKRFAGSDSVNYHTLGGFLELSGDNPIVNVSAGARYDNNSAVGGALVPRVALLRLFGPVSLKAIFSLAFRWPGIENLNIAPGLTPERTTVYELEGAVDLAKGFRLALNVFNAGISAPIVYTPTPRAMRAT